MADELPKTKIGKHGEKLYLVKRGDGTSVYVTVPEESAKPNLPRAPLSHHKTTSAHKTKHKVLDRKQKHKGRRYDEEATMDAKTLLKTLNEARFDPKDATPMRGSPGARETVPQTANRLNTQIDKAFAQLERQLKELKRLQKSYSKAMIDSESWYHSGDLGRIAETVEDLVERSNWAE